MGGAGGMGVSALYPHQQKSKGDSRTEGGLGEAGGTQLFAEHLVRVTMAAPAERAACTMANVRHSMSFSPRDKGTEAER